MKSSGCGIGLRSKHYPIITHTWPEVDWFEAISENYMDTGGRPLHILEKVRKRYPIALHGTALSIGSTDSLSLSYLIKLKKLVDKIDPFIISDHLCWSSVNGDVLHDLLPLPFTQEAIRHVVKRVGQVQEFLGRRILLENVSTYVTYRHSTIPEWEFITEIAEHSGCGLLLDINNVFVNATNHGFDPYEYIKSIPGTLVGQIHLAGHTDMGEFLFDTHSTPVIEEVWKLYRYALSLWGQTSTLIEWDENIPELERLIEEAEKARVIYKEFEGAAKQMDTQCHPEAKSKDLRMGILRSAQNDKRWAGTPPRNDETIKTPPLQETETWIKSYIYPGSGAQQGLSLLNSQGSVSGEERLQVYADGYPARVQESLADAYPAVKKISGHERFSILCRAYAYKHPSRQYNLNFAGRHFPEFLDSVSFPEFPFLADLARFEWLVWESFHAFDETPLTPIQAADIPAEMWEEARIIFQPSVRIFSSEWPVLDIWKTRKEEQGKSPQEWLLRHQNIFLKRKDDQVWCEPIDKVRHRLLGGLLSGKSLGTICTELTDEVENSDVPVSDWFSKWMSEGLIVRCEFPDKTICVQEK